MPSSPTPALHSLPTRRSSDLGPDCSWCVNLGGNDSGPRPPPAEVPTRSRVVQITRLDPAMLIHRVEPVYPALGKQLHRDGHVELRSEEHTSELQSLRHLVCRLLPRLLFTLSLHDALPILAPTVPGA